MPTYSRFEDLPVWQKAADVAARLFEWSQQHIGQGNGDLASQLQRAALSISNNIAEGFERGSTNELIQVLYIARGSAGEVRSMFCVMERMPSFSHLKSEISDFKSECEKRKHLPPDPRLDRQPAEQRHQRPAAPEQRNAKAIRTEAAPLGILATSGPVSA